MRGDTMNFDDVAYNQSTPIVETCSQILALSGDLQMKGDTMNFDDAAHN